jgi:hydroxyethylthiazole kinase-like uncharacterized protein yjeF
MKILPVELIREADAYTIKNEPIASIDLMERAAYQCFKWIKKVVRRDAPINIFCGPGNNGGDGLVISRLLIADGYHVVTIILRVSDKFSPDFITNLEHLEKSKKAVIYNVTTLQDLPDIPDGSIIIDAIFGSGLSKPIEGFAAEVIRLINDTNSTRIAIDIPSGLYADQHSALPKAAIVKADYTLTFQYPKLSFLFAENEHYVGKWIVLPIGLMDEATKDKEIRNFTIDRADAFSLLKSRTQFSHKGHFGHALLIAGSYGKTGAAVLAAQAALRSGAGLVTAHLPASSRQIMQTGMPEWKRIEKKLPNGHKDFSEIIELAKTCPPPTEIETGEITIGFAHNQVMALADKILDAVNSGAIKKMVVMSGCDARQKTREYYTEFAKQLPKDTVILTSGCAKYRYNKLKLGDIGGIPRVLDAGQCNDSYSWAFVALKLKEVLKLDDINKLPIVFNIAWYEQKAIIVHLALLYLGIKNTHVGPTLPAWLTPNLLKAVQESFGVQTITTVEEDMKIFELA